jgi:hypothetical protein
MFEILREWYELYKINFAVPECVKQHTQSYFSSQSIHSFIIENYDVNDKKQGNISLDEVKRNYNEYLSKNLSIKDIKNELTETGFVTTHWCLVGWKKK